MGLKPGFLGSPHPPFMLMSLPKYATHILVYFYHLSSTLCLITLQHASALFICSTSDLFSYKVSFHLSYTLSSNSFSFLCVQTILAYIYHSSFSCFTILALHSCQYQNLYNLIYLHYIPLQSIMFHLFNNHTIVYPPPLL